MSYDVRCEDLARVFLGDSTPYTEADVEALAQEIQNTIEDWLESR